MFRCKIYFCRFLIPNFFLLLIGGGVGVVGSLSQKGRGGGHKQMSPTFLLMFQNLVDWKGGGKDEANAPSPPTVASKRARDRSAYEKYAMLAQIFPEWEGGGTRGPRLWEEIPQGTLHFFCSPGSFAWQNHMTPPAILRIGCFGLNLRGTRILLNGLKMGNQVNCIAACVPSH